MGLAATAATSPKRRDAVTNRKGRDDRADDDEDLILVFSYF